MSPQSSPAEKAYRAMEGRSLPEGPVLPTDARVVLHFHPDTGVDALPVLRRILQDGRYSSQFVTRTGNGGLTASPGMARWQWEHRIFAGAYDDATAGERPVYGALRLEADPYGAAPRFGSAHLVLRTDVLARSTFAYPDSTFEPSHVGVIGRLGLLRHWEAAHPSDPLNHYVEAHVHGGLRVPQDVEAVVVDPSFADAAALRLAKTVGLPVLRHPGYALTAGDLDRCAAYRGPDVVELGRSLLADGLLTPAELGAVRGGDHIDPGRLKQLWHVLARYGRSPGPMPR